MEQEEFKKDNRASEPKTAVPEQLELTTIKMQCGI